ncbi:MAG: hypothetical protein ACRDKW_09845, partial [Actinomycetota bacterium]
TFVAVVVAGAAPGQVGPDARAYVCDGADVLEWFDQGGVTEGSPGSWQIDLRSAAGARLSGTLTEETGTGTVALPGGASLAFEVARATGAQGLYSITVAPDGRVTGMSADGGRIEGQLLIAGTITPPDGEAVPYQLALAMDDAAELRTIYRAGQGSRGGGNTRKGTELLVREP